MKTLETQEDIIIYILLNFMAFEGAKDTFDIPLPEGLETIHGNIKKIGYPKKRDQKELDYK